MMDGLYTKAEAAQILRVSERQINNYFSEGKLSRLYLGKKVYTQKREVDELYTRLSRGPVINPETVESLLTRVESLEKEVRVLKAGLGFGSQKPLRKETELLSLRQQMLDDLGRSEWSAQKIMKVAKELAGVRPEEVELLIKVAGVTAWVPFVDLGKRMLRQVESDPNFPAGGLDVLSEKLSAAHKSFMGLVYSSTHVDELIDSRVAASAINALEIGPNTIETHIVAYLSK